MITARRVCEYGRWATSLETPMKGITLEGETCTVLVGAQEGGTRIGLLIFRDGAREPEGVDFPYEQATALHEVLGSALESVRGRLG